MQADRNPGVSREDETNSSAWGTKILHKASLETPLETGGSTVFNPVYNKGCIQLALPQRSTNTKQSSLRPALDVLIEATFLLDLKILLK